MKNRKFKILLVTRVGDENKAAIANQLTSLSIPKNQYEIVTSFHSGADDDDIGYVQRRIDELNNQYRRAAEKAIAYYERIIPKHRKAMEESTIPQEVKFSKESIDRDSAALATLQSLIAQGRFVDPEMERVLGGGIGKNKLESDSQCAKRRHETLEHLKFDPKTALGIIRKGLADNDPVDAVVIVDHSFTGDAAVDSNREFAKLINGIPEGVPILFVGQRSKALENGLAENSIIERLPPLEFGLKRDEDSQFHSNFYAGDKPVPIAGNDDFFHPDIPPIEWPGNDWEKFAQLINGPGYELSPDEAEAIAVVLSKLIKTKYPPSHLPKDRKNPGKDGMGLG